MLIMPTKEEAIKDIFETEEEIRELELKAQLKPRFASAYYNMIAERKELFRPYHGETAILNIFSWRRRGISVRIWNKKRLH